VPVSYFDPRPDRKLPSETYDQSIDVTVAPVRLGLIANAFPDAERFLRHVERQLQQAAPLVTITHYMKPNTSAASASLRGTIAEECDAIVSSYGH
jgi:hypothetical protein